jgi:hypothetical protein
MRVDRILNEGESIIALRRAGFEVHDAPYRPGLYEVSHSALGGTRTFTEEQLCRFAEGVTCTETLLKRVATEMREARA